MKIKATIERIPGGMMLIPSVIRRSVKYVSSGYRCVFRFVYQRNDQRNGTDSGSVVFVSAHLLIYGQPARYYASPVRW